MRSMLIASLVAAGLGVGAASSSMAAPVNAAALGELANTGAPVTQVWWHHHHYWRHGGHWRWGSYGGHWRWGSRGYY